MKLDAAGCFSNIPDNYLFVFNYTNIVTEMDIVTILSEKNKDDVFIDIEVWILKLSSVFPQNPAFSLRTV